MTTIGSSNSLSQAHSLLQVFQVSSLNNGLRNDTENKTAAEKIQEIVSGTNDYSKTAAQAQIIAAQLNAEAAAAAAAEKAEETEEVEGDFGFEIGGVFYENVEDMSEVDRINAYRAAKNSMHFIEAGSSHEQNGFSSEFASMPDTFSERMGHVKFEISGTNRPSLHDPVYQEYLRVSQMTNDIEDYYRESYGVYSLEYITLSHSLLESREDILAERDTVVEQYGYQSLEYVEFISDFFTNKTNMSFAQHTTPDGMRITFQRDQDETGMIKSPAENISPYFLMETEEGSEWYLFDSETRELKSFYDAIQLDKLDTSKAVPVDLSQANVSNIEIPIGFAGSIF
ncbi:hypothetical protein [Flexibacterium corallicola]|uniref:hypothetical protein n=1 Tax=Flexibacterium corallicola TaxID=3037259 RepID=UPI00286F74DB|nr:hypothetical protein [Pseudovibrio sp. M1P-2-3]